MALAETELEATKETVPQKPLETLSGRVPLGRDAFVKRRQAAREAASSSSELRTGSGTSQPEGGDEISPSDGIPPRGETAQNEVGQIQAEPGDDLSLIDDDEMSGAEPSKLTGLEPPASMTASEKEAYEALPDGLKGYVSRIHTSAAQKISENGDSLAARNKEIETRVAELDRSLVQAKAVLQAQTELLPYSQQDLDAIADKQGFEEWQKAVAANAAAKADTQKKLNEIDGQIRERQKQVLTQLNQDLPKLIPTWAKLETRKKEGAELNAYLLSNGFKQAEVNQVVDARLVALARKAMRYDAALERKRGRAAKPSAKPGAAGGRRSVSSGNAELTAAEKHYRQNPTADSFAALRQLRREAAVSNSRRRV